LVALDDVPVGGAVSATNAAGTAVIISRPSESEVRGFSAICTHRGCTVAPDGSELRCPCHGSVFEAATGRNVGGPAPSPLPEFSVEIDGGQVVEA
jgi:Rieske Fe-S protein